MDNWCCEHAQPVVRSRKTYIRPLTSWNRRLEVLNMTNYLAATDFALVTPGLRPGYDIGATETCWNRGQIVKRTNSRG